MIKLSMVMTSRSRREEIKRYIDSLNRQSEEVFKFLQLIFVDQGDNKNLFEVLDSQIDFKYISYHTCSLSEARNVGLEFVNGDYICFPDDDCWYDDNTLKLVIDKLEKKPTYDGVIITAKDDKDQKINVFPDREQFITYQNHCGGLSISMFLKFDSELCFDENIGVGSKYNLSSGEETDYLLTYMEHHPGFKIWFTPDIVIRHPLAKHDGFESSVMKTYGYARGNGYIIRKHQYNWHYKMLALIKPMVWVVVYSIINRKKRERAVAYCKGRIEGFFYKIG